MNPYSTIRINGREYNSGNLNSLLTNNTKDNDSEWLTQICEFLSSWFADKDYIETKTSGSTGSPKTIRMPKAAMIHSALATKAYFDLQKGYAALLCLPAAYIAGKMMLVRAMVCDLELQIVKPSANPFFNNNDIIHFVAISPYQLSHSLEILKKREVHKIIVGGSAISTQMEMNCMDLPPAIYETYGMTETMSHIALRKVNGSDKSEYFHVLPDITIKQDNRDCLIINAPELFEGDLVTNDVVAIKNDMSFKWLGRFDNVINSGGIKIFPEQVERKLEPFIQAKFIVGSSPDDSLGEKIILIIEGLEPSETELTAFRKRISDKLTKYEMPREIYYLPAFPVTISGKLNRKGLIRTLI